MSNVQKENILCQSCGFLLPNQMHTKLCKVDIEFRCSKCNKIFSKLKYLNQHTKTHLKSNIQCPLCDKQLKTKQNLKEHTDKIHKKGQQHVTCNICDSKFIRKSDLERHKKIHSSKLYFCNICNKQFHFHYNLQNHLVNCKKQT